MTKKLLAVFALVGAAGVAGWTTRPGHGIDRTPPPPPQGPYVPDRAAANGLVEGVTPEVAVHPEVLGRITAVHYREGDTVAKGAVIVELNGKAQRAQLAVAEAEIKVAHAELTRLVNGERPERRRALTAAENALKTTVEQEEARWKRVTKLTASGGVSGEQAQDVFFNLARARAELERIQADRALVYAPAREDEVATANAKIHAARARRNLARAELDKTRLLAPCDGTVLQRFAEPGDMAGPATNRPILLLADMSRRRVRAFVEELDAARVRPGQSAVVTADGLPGQQFPGTVAQVLPRMGRRAPETNDPGEYKDVYHREVLIDLAGAQSLPLNLRVRVLIDAPAGESPR